MDEKVYEHVAKKYGVTVAEVKAEMQAALNVTFENPNHPAQRIPRKGAVPTIEEFINFAVDEISKNKNAK